MTDNGLAALAAALHRYRGTCELWTMSEASCPIDHAKDAAAILPAFLADPRTHEWLEERLVVEGYPEGWILRAFAAAILGGKP